MPYSDKDIIHNGECDTKWQMRWQEEAYEVMRPSASFRHPHQCGRQHPIHARVHIFILQLLVLLKARLITSYYVHQLLKYGIHWSWRNKIQWYWILDARCIDRGLRCAHETTCKTIVTRVQMSSSSIWTPNLVSILFWFWCQKVHKLLNLSDWLYFVTPIFTVLL